MSKSNAARQPALKKPLDDTSPNFNAKSPFQRWGKFSLDMLMSGAAPWPPRGVRGHNTESFNFELIGRIWSKAKMEDVLSHALSNSSIKDTPWAQELFDVITLLWAIGRPNFQGDGKISLEEARILFKRRNTYIMFMDLKDSVQQYDPKLPNPFLRKENFFIGMSWLDLNPQEAEIWQSAFDTYVAGMNENAGLSPGHHPRHIFGMLTTPANIIDTIYETNRKNITDQPRPAWGGGKSIKVANNVDNWKDLRDDSEDSGVEINTKKGRSYQAHKNKQSSKPLPSFTGFKTTYRPSSVVLPTTTSSVSIDAITESTKSLDEGISMIERQMRKRRRGTTSEQDAKLIPLMVETIAVHGIWMTDIADAVERNKISEVRKIVENFRKLHPVERMALTASVDAEKMVEDILGQDPDDVPHILNRRWDDLA